MGYPRVLDNENFIDSSWHHNELPSVDHVISTEDFVLIVWVAEKTSTDFCFVVHVYNVISGDNDFEEFAIDEKECLEFIEKAVQFIKNIKGDNDGN